MRFTEAHNFDEELAREEDREHQVRLQPNVVSTTLVCGHGHFSSHVKKIVPPRLREGTHSSETDFANSPEGEDPQALR